MKLEDLEAKLGISSDLSDEERLALVKDLQANLPSLKNNLVKLETQTQANLVKQAIKKIQENLENRFNELSGFIENKASKVVNGKDGLQGPKGEQGNRGLDGAPGIQGPKGDQGKDGQDGEQGVGVADARVDFDGSLIITLTDGTEINAGEVLPLDTTEKLKVYFNNPAVSGSSLPDQAGNSGKYLTTDGTNASWGSISGSSGGTVTSVAVSGGTTGLTTSGGPVTSSGTITLAGTLAVANGGTGATTAGAALTALGAYAASNPSGYTSNTGTVTSVSGTGTVNGLSLSGTVTTTGNLTLGGTLDLSSPPAIGGTTAAAGTFTTLTATGQTSLGGAAGSESLRVAAGATNGSYSQVTGTASYVEFRTLGTNANNSMYLVSRGTGTINFYTNNSTSNEQFRVSPTTSAVNYVQVTGATTASKVVAISAQGSDTDVTLDVIPKGAGTVRTSGTGVRLVGATSGYVGLKGAAVAGSTTYTLPAADGTNGQVLATNGSATLSWATASGGGALAKQTDVFTTGTAATYTAPANTQWVKITVVGAGANGAGTTVSRATGGGAGGVAYKWFAMTAGQTLTYSVGAAGASGGASSVSSGTATITTITANGGGSATTTAYAAGYTLGPAGGTATGGDINIQGGSGGGSGGSSTTSATNTSGKGGDCPGWGIGGASVGNAIVVGNNGVGYGAGGSGGQGTSTAGNGTGGIIIFEAY